MPRETPKKPTKLGEFHIRLDSELGKLIRFTAAQSGQDYNVRIERLIRRGLEAEKAA